MSSDQPSARLTSTPAGVRLGPLAIIADGKARNFVLEIKGQRFHGFIVRSGNTVSGYVDLCPHMGLPLAQKLDDYMTPTGDYIACSWHGALFTRDTGKCIGGPCMGQSLTPWPVSVVDGSIITGPNISG